MEEFRQKVNNRNEHRQPLPEKRENQENEISGLSKNVLPDRFKFITASILLAGFFIYTFYLYGDLPEQQIRFTEKAERGKILWQEKNCIACHQIYGLGGFLGPDLTNIYSFREESFIRAFISGGNGTMPSFRLQDDQMNDLIAYLKIIDASGNSDPRTFMINYDGTISQK